MNRSFYASTDVLFIRTCHIGLNVPALHRCSAVTNHPPSLGSSQAGSSGQRSASTSRSLLEQIRLNDRSSWDRLLRLYAPLVFHWCRKWNLQHADAADIFQEVFRSVAANVCAFQKESKSDTFRGWLRTITHNKVRDHYRRIGREPAGIGGTEANDHWHQMPCGNSDVDSICGQVDSDPAERAVCLRALELIRNEFEPRTWQAFFKTTVEGQTAAEVALELKMSPGAVRVAKSRVLHRLRQELGDV